MEKSVVVWQRSMVYIWFKSNDVLVAKLYMKYKAI